MNSKINELGGELVEGYFHPLTRCASCLNMELEEIFDFGAVPLAGYFPLPGEEDSRNLLPMTLYRCSVCELVQISPVVDDSYLFSDYRYRSSFSMKSHFRELAKWIASRGFTISDRILEIGSNDGTLIQELRNLGLDCMGVDPATNIIEYSRNLGHEVINGNFSSAFVHSNDLTSKFDLIISCNSFAHIENIRDVSQGVSQALKIGGSFLVEVQSWDQLLERGAFDFVYHEHKYYYDLNSLSYLVAQVGLELISAETVDSHGGSLRCHFVKRDKSDFGLSGFTPQSNKLSSQLILDAITNFFESINKVKKEVQEIQASGGKIVGFGASGRANMLLAHMNLQNCITAVFDESPERIGRSMGFSGIPIQAFESLREDQYTHCIVLAWNFFDSIKRKWPHPSKILMNPLPHRGT